MDVVRGLAAKRRLEAGQDFDRAQVRIKVEPEADSEQQVAERNVVWHARPAVGLSADGPGPDCAGPDCSKPNGSKKDGVVRPQLIKARFGHHASRAQIILAAPFKLAEVQREFARRRLQDFHRGGDNFTADAVTRDKRDAIALHDANRHRDTESEMMNSE